jgi:Glycosyl transferase family 11
MGSELPSKNNAPGQRSSRDKDDMITFRELGNMGRLGNQMFQIAATVALAIRNNDDYIFPPWPSEPFFSLTNCFSNELPNGPTFTEPSFTYSPIPYQPNLNINGFFQSEKYFEDQQNVIRSLLTPKHGYGIQYGYTAIHVRRGDYTNLTKEYTQLDMSYYGQAMNIIGSKNYIIFSDDIPWCKNNFRGDGITFSEDKSPVEDLALMASCENQIIANSSFSWWGAYLNNNPTKTIIAPYRWFGPALPHNVRDLTPPTWTKI